MLTAVTGRDEVEAGIFAFNESLENFSTLSSREAADLKQALPRARSWVAVQKNGRWSVGFSKFVGHRQANGGPLTPALYARHRKNISGTDSERAIKRFPGRAYPVGWMASGATGTPQHPAVEAVESLCRRFGKQPNSLSEVYVLQGEDVPADERSRIDIVLAAVKAAKLSREGLALLMERIETL